MAIYNLYRDASNIYGEPTIYKKREKSVPRVDNLTVDNNGLVSLVEIPNVSARVKVFDGDTLLTEVERKELNENEYYVDYVEGWVYFHESQKGKTLRFEYSGDGVKLIPASRIYLSENGYFSGKTLQDILNNFEGELKVGDLDKLTTEEKETIVDAINELHRLLQLATGVATIPFEEHNHDGEYVPIEEGFVPSRFLRLAEANDINGYSEVLARIDHQHPEYEPKIVVKRSAFNKDFGETYDTVARGKHSHPEYIEKDENGKLPLKYLPDITSKVAGEHDASLGFYPLNPKIGDSYIITKSGTIDGKQFEVGDMIVYTEEDRWIKISRPASGINSIKTLKGTYVTDFELTYEDVLPSLEGKQGKVLMVSATGIPQWADIPTLKEIQSAFFNKDTGLFTIATNSGSTFQVNLDGRYLLKTEEEHMVSGSFNSATGVITLKSNTGRELKIDISDIQTKDNNKLTNIELDEDTGDILFTVANDILTLNLDNRYIKRGDINPVNTVVMDIPSKSLAIVSQDGKTSYIKLKDYFLPKDEDININGNVFVGSSEFDDRELTFAIGNSLERQSYVFKYENTSTGHVLKLVTTNDGSPINVFTIPQSGLIQIDSQIKMASGKTFFEHGTYAIDLNKSDIIGANRIVFKNTGDGEGLLFLRSGSPSNSSNLGHYDVFRVEDGLIYLNDNKVYHEGFKPSSDDVRAIAKGSKYAIDLNQTFETGIYHYDIYTTGRPSNYGVVNVFVRGGETHDNTTTTVFQFSYGDDGATKFRYKIGDASWTSWYDIWNSKTLDANSLATKQELSIELENTENIVKQYADFKKAEAIEEANRYTNLRLADYATASSVSEQIEMLQSQIDGAISTWFAEGEPTLENYPANEWEDESEKNFHLGDLYYDISTGKAYRFAYEDDEFKWLQITDTDIAEALEIANDAYNLAGTKNKITYSSTPPQNPIEGDVWYNVDTREFKVWSGQDWVEPRYVGQEEVDLAKLEAIQHADQELEKEHKKSKGSNLVNNPYFESMSSTWWHGNFEVLLRTNELVPENAPLPYVIMQEGEVQSNRENNFKDYIYVSPGEKYKISLTAANNNASGTLQFGLIDDNNNTYLTTVQQTEKNWKKHEFELVIPEGVNKIRMIIIANGIWFWCDPKIIKVLQDDEIDSADKWNAKPEVYRQATQPIAKNVGDIWIDTDSGEMYVWTGSEWSNDLELTRRLNEAQQAAIDYVNLIKEELDEQIDEKVENWFGYGVPTLTNEPAVNWHTNEEKEKHLKDTYYDLDAGESYIFLKNDSGVYGWYKIDNQNIQKALEDASRAQATADGKITTFYGANEPTNAQEGDLWVQGSSGDILIFQNGNWVKSSKYTDDTRAILSEENALRYVREINNLKVRYIRDYLNGSDLITQNRWVEVKVFRNGINIANGILPSASATPTRGSLSLITDGDTSSSSYVELPDGEQYIQIDLGAVYTDIDYIQTWHYNNHTFNHKLMVSEDGNKWIELFNSYIDGTYKETIEGKRIYINVLASSTKEYLEKQQKLMYIDNKTDIYFPFDKNLCSTNGINPKSGYTAILTDEARFGKALDIVGRKIEYGISLEEQGTISLYFKSPNSFPYTASNDILFYTGGGYGGDYSLNFAKVSGDSTVFTLNWGTTSGENLTYTLQYTNQHFKNNDWNMLTITWKLSEGFTVYLNGHKLTTKTAGSSLKPFGNTLTIRNMYLDELLIKEVVLTDEEVGMIYNAQRSFVDVNPVNIAPNPSNVRITFD